MERLRAEVAEEALRLRLPPHSPQSIASVSSSSAVLTKSAASGSSDRPAAKIKHHRKIIYDSDEEEAQGVNDSIQVISDVESENDIVILDHPPALKFPVPHPSPSPDFVSGPLFPKPRPYVAKIGEPFRTATNVPVFTQNAKTMVFPIPVPTNKKPPSFNINHEAFDDPQDSPYEYEIKKTAAEADKELKELFEGAMEDGVHEVNMEEAIVDGFAEGIVLKQHQIKGRVWMRERETGKKAGGLLCDEMGLGKTIQTVVRIVDGPPSKEDRRNGWARATLIVCPVALVKQWAQEIKKYTGGGLRVIEHYGPSRTADPDLLARAHVVVTSYNTVASEYATYSGDGKDESSQSKSKKKDGPEFDADSDDSADSSNFGKTLKQARAAKKAPAKKKGKKLNALFGVQWWRIALDEAHTIKNRTTKNALACFTLEAKYRWALTGTPVQNGVEDLYSLLKFLRIKPLSDWSNFNTNIAQPVKAGRTSRAMKRLHVVMKAIMLRRLKDTLQDGEPLIKLPPMAIEIVECDFDDDELEFYKALEQKTTVTMNKFIKKGEVMRNYTEVMVLLLRLRQACNHPILVSKDFQKDADALDSRLAGKNGPDDEDDGGLADLFQKMAVHTTKRCDVCRTELKADESRSRCADCERRLAIETRRKSARVGSDLPPSSAKIRKIMELLETIDRNSDGQEKTIIFSQFTSMLDLIEPFLRDEGIEYVRYDGSMNTKQREQSLEKIRSSQTTRVILISFKAGGAGLNLTSCNNVILVDLWWNPALEEQAFGRVHRYGQERDVMVYKLTIEATIEQRILALQETKRQLANAALSGDKVKNNKLGMDDILALFRPDGKDSDDEGDDDGRGRR